MCADASVAVLATVSTVDHPSGAEHVADVLTSAVWSGGWHHPIGLQLDIERVWRGDPPDRMIVRTGFGTGDCGLPYDVGTPLVICRGTDETLFLGSFCAPPDTYPDVAAYEEALGPGTAARRASLRERIDAFSVGSWCLWAGLLSLGALAGVASARSLATLRAWTPRPRAAGWIVAGMGVAIVAVRAGQEHLLGPPVAFLPVETWGAVAAIWAASVVAVGVVRPRRLIPTAVAAGVVASLATQWSAAAPFATPWSVACVVDATRDALRDLPPDATQETVERALAGRRACAGGAGVPVGLQPRRPGTSRARNCAVVYDSDATLWSVCPTEDEPFLWTGWATTR